MRLINLQNTRQCNLRKKSNRHQMKLNHKNVLFVAKLSLTCTTNKNVKEFKDVSSIYMMQMLQVL